MYINLIYVSRKVEEYIEKAIVGFDGKNFYEGCYKGKSYLVLMDKDIWLLSNEVITNRSRKYRDGYLTDITLNQLDDLVLSKMYATYKENEYEVQRVHRRLRKIELLARKDKLEEDLQLGFEDDIYERITHKIITKEEIENIRIERKSVYNQFKIRE